MAFQVIDAAGRLIELEDGKPVPPGCKLMVSPLWMDSEQRANAAAYPPKPGPDDDDDDDEGDGEHRDAEQAYLAMKARLGRGKRQPISKKRRRVVLGGDSGPNERARLAYQQRS